MVSILTEMLEPHLPGTGELDVLYGGAEEWVPGHKNYAAEPSPTKQDLEAQRLADTGDEPF